MNSHLPTDQFPPGVDRGEFVPLPIQEFPRAYAMILHALAGNLPRDPTFPTEVQDAKTGEAVPFRDTPLNRAWYTGGRLFADDAQRTSFRWRVKTVMPIAREPKYRKYVDDQAGAMHIALLSAVATVRGSLRTTPKALREAFDAEFRRHLATTVDPELDRRQ